ncbi:MAG: hypothetical protein E5Y02_28570 [Mesorhizobium sp.]|uniref:hypothetical protein n=1 Tax=Mesorhizobium sp. B263B2A TaxID=2876669 RepID=UPI0012236F1C|nr:hypothetical protein [Mesorhizobium sp. B263B2A]MCA0032652.1 hypothetical protein [Mesorhizobium sp. B263B2A]TJV38706.1 MAG: hypothetical protein E5Y02_28570 [Mesorhizobium sp.]
MAKVPKSRRAAGGSAGDGKRAGGRRGPVRVGLYGLGHLLKAIDAAGKDVQGQFQGALGNQDVTVTLSPTLAAKIKEFVTQNGIAAPPKTTGLKAAARNHDNCDPRTDPWCIDI